MEYPRCRLVLVTPATPDPSKFSEILSAAFAGGDISTVILAPETEDLELWRDLADIARPRAIEAGAAFLVAGQISLVDELRADGIHVETGHSDLTAMVKSLAPERIVGAGAIFNRHTAMSVGETGVDYVFFGRVNLTPDDRKAAEIAKNLTEWWRPLFQVPCVAFASTMDDAGELIRLGADFVALGGAIWDHPEGPEAAVKAINRLIEENTSDQ